MQVGLKRRDLQMKTLIFEVVLASLIPASSTRENGRLARQAIQRILRDNEVVEIDLIGVRLSPSFADECFGVLAESLGRDPFKNRVKIRNVPSVSRELLKHVIIRRTQMA